MKTGANHLTLRIAISIFCGIIILLLPLVSAGAGQQIQEKSTGTVQKAFAPAASSEYASEPVVIEQINHSFTFNADGTGSREVTVAARAQSDAVVRQLGLLTIPFTPTVRIRVYAELGINTNPYRGCHWQAGSCAVKRLNLALFVAG
jgi:hypothetical protein